MPSNNPARPVPLSTTALGARIRELQERRIHATDVGQIVDLEQQIGQLRHQLEALGGSLEPLTPSVPAQTGTPKVASQPKTPEAPAYTVLTRVEQVTAKQAEKFLTYEEKIPHRTSVAAKIDQGYRWLTTQGVPASVVMNIQEYAKTADQNPGLYLVEFGGRGWEQLTPELQQQFRDRVPQGFVIRQQEESEPEEPVEEEPLEEEAPVEEPPSESDIPMDKPDDLPQEEKPEGEEIPSETQLETLTEEIKNLTEIVQENTQQVQELLDTKQEPLVDDSEEWKPITPDEFGLEEPFNTVYGQPQKPAKLSEQRRSTMTLRDDRQARLARRAQLQQRLAQRKTAAEERPEETSLEEIWKPEDQETYKEFDANPPAGVPVTEKQIDQKVKEDLEALPEVYHPVEAAQYKAALKALNVELKRSSRTKKLAWFVQNESEPVYQINELPSSKGFSKREYGVSILTAIKQKGLRAAMRIFQGARVAKTTKKPASRPATVTKPAAQVPAVTVPRKPTKRAQDEKPGTFTKFGPKTPEEIEKEKKEKKEKEEAQAAVQRKPVASEISSAVAESMVAHKARMDRAMKLAIAASVRNLVTENPLKCALYQRLAELGVDQPNTVIDQAFDEAGETHFEMLNQAAKRYYQMSDEALVDLEQQIQQMPTFQSPASSIEQVQVMETEAMRRRASEGSSPLIGTGNAPSRREQIRSVVPQPYRSQAAEILLNGRK